jgi:hypothetical protein
VKKMALFLLVFTKQSGSAPKPTTMLDFLSKQSIVWATLTKRVK